MRKVVGLLSLSLALFLLLSGPVLGAGTPPAKGGILPEINLPIPNSPSEKSYLGLSAPGFFKIPQIKAKLVIVQIFSMYCPFCQKDAPGVNELYYAVENNPDLKDKIKMIGIGAGNSSYEVQVFKKTYQVPFPLFPDKDFAIHKVCGEIRTPYYIAVRINQNGTHEVVHSELGGFKGAEPFLELILKAAGLKKED